MKRIIVFFVLIILLFSGCNNTNIKNKGIITINPIGNGPIYDLTLIVPSNLENNVYKAIWSCNPQDSGIIRFEENNLFGEDALSYKRDRTARITLLDVEGVVVSVYMLHKDQTSPQLFAEITIGDND